MLRVAIDVREAQGTRKTGKGQWSAGFLRELLTRGVEVIPFGMSGIAVAHSPLWHLQTARKLRASREIDVYVSPTSYIVPFLLGKSTPFIPIIHDLIAFRHEPHNRKAKLIEHLLLKSTVQNARHICTVSETTKGDLLVQYPFLTSDFITPIFAGPMREENERSAEAEKIILCIGTLCPRKNQLGLIHAYRLLPSTLRAAYSLVLAGGHGWHDSEIIRAALETPGVRLLGHVSETEYHALLQHSTLFAFPSFYEGFGMSVLDALAYGVPVLTSDCGSLREIAGDAAVFVNPNDAQSVAHGLLELITNPGLREKLSDMGKYQAGKFSWKRTVDLFLDIAEKAL